MVAFSGEGPFLVHSPHLLPVSSHRQWQGDLWGLSHKGTHEGSTPCPHALITSPRPHLLKLSSLGVRISTYEFAGTQMFRPQQSMETEPCFSWQYIQIHRFLRAMRSPSSPCSLNSGRRRYKDGNQTDMEREPERGALVGEVRGENYRLFLLRRERKRSKSRRPIIRG